MYDLPMTLESTQKKQLRALAHKLKPIVIVGSASLTPGVIEEIDRSLEHHELLKVRVNAGDRKARTEMVARMCQETRSELVQVVGHVVTLFRKGKSSSSVG